MGEEKEEKKGIEESSCENGEENEEKEQHVLKFLDSMDSYLILMESLSSTLRQGWLGLASARHSMGSSRINGALLDLKYHSAATSLRINHHDAEFTMEQPHFTLCKWVLPNNVKCCPGEEKFDESDLLRKKSNGQQLQNWGSSQYSEIQETRTESDGSGDGSPLTVDRQVQKERSKSLSMFGTLVSPKLRASQLSFETALEILVEIANMRSSVLCAYDQVRKEFDTTRG